jgi:hypothetical protein
MGASPRSGISRETRLLLVVIILSVGVLVVLSRFRFPDEPDGAPRTGATPLPLERLAARATYDELASIVADLGRRVTPAVSVIRAETAQGGRFIPAVRLRPDILLAHVAADSRLLSFVDLQAAIDVAAYDEARRLVLLRVPPDAARVARIGNTPPGSLAPRYVASMEGTRAGPALRPLFLGRADAIPDPRYEGGLFVLGGVLQASPGALIFSLDGSFVGLCLIEGGDAAGVPARALDNAVTAMLRPPVQ